MEMALRPSIRNLKTYSCFTILAFTLIFILTLFFLRILRNHSTPKEGYSLQIHHILSLRYKTPANNFDIYVDRAFQSLYSDEERASILRKAEVKNIEILKVKCERLLDRIEGLNRTLKDYYDPATSPGQRMELSKLNRELSVCEVSHLSAVQKFKQYYG